MDDLLDSRRQANAGPESDLTAALMHEKVWGRPLSNEEIASVLRNWTAGEIGTIAAAVGILAQYLATHEELQRQLRAETNLLPTAIDEILRIHGPLVSNRRVATRDAEIGGQKINAGDRVTVNWISANRDEAVFEKPDEFRLDRDPSKNLLYGAGIHVCPGAPLARMELRVFMEELLKSTTNIAAIPEKAPTHAVDPASGFAILPAIWDVRPVHMMRSSEVTLDSSAIALFRRFLMNTAVVWPMLGLYLVINHHQATPTHIVTMPPWVPFSPAFFPVYFGLMLVTWLLPVVIGERARFRACLRANICAWLLVMPWWIFFPTMMPRPALPEGPWADAFYWLWAMDRPYNVMPCAHGMGPVVAAWFVGRERPAWRWPLIAILLATLPSIALVWQHRPIDILLGTVAAGIGIALGEWFYRNETSPLHDTMRRPTQ